MTTPTALVSSKELPTEEQQALANSLVICHDGMKGRVSGSDCINCPYFGGITTPQETARETNPHRRYRGACLFPLNRAVVSIKFGEDTKSTIRCPEAPLKLEAAKRFDVINTRHCTNCPQRCSNKVKAMNGQQFIRCASPKGIQFLPLNPALLE